MNSGASCLKSSKILPSTDTNENPVSHSPGKKAVYFHKVHERRNSTQNEFHESDSIIINSSDADENNDDDDFSDKTYNLYTELNHSDSESESGGNRGNVFEMHDTIYQEIPNVSDIEENFEHSLIIYEMKDPNNLISPEVVQLLFFLESDNGITTESYQEIDIHDGNIITRREIPVIFDSESNDDPYTAGVYEMVIHDGNDKSFEKEAPNLEENNSLNTEVTDEMDIHEPLKKKSRLEQKYLKDHGMEYSNRSGRTIPRKQFKELVDCCRHKCDNVCSPEIQKLIFEYFYKQKKKNQYRILSNGITFTDKKRLGKYGKYGTYHYRLITASYFLRIKNKNRRVCKKMFQSVYGISRGKIDVLRQIKKMSDPGTLQFDNRGHHKPHNKMTKEKENMRNYLKKYPIYQSRYSCKNADTFSFPCHLNIKKLYEEYTIKNYGKKCGSYDLFKDVFNKTGYTFEKSKNSPELNSIETDSSSED